MNMVASLLNRMFPRPEFQPPAPGVYLATDAQREAWESLSPRYQQIVELVCLGYTNREGAQVLDLSEQTIKKYVANVLQGLGLHGKGELRAFFAPPADAE